MVEVWLDFTSKFNIIYIRILFCLSLMSKSCNIVGRGGALVESMPFDRRVAGSNPAIATT